MNVFSIRPYLPALIHLLVWTTLGVMLLVLHPLSWNVSLPTQFWIMQGVIFSVFVGLYYLNANVWVPRFLFRNKSWLFIFLALTTGILVLVLINVASDWLNLPELMHQAANPGRAAKMGGRGGRNGLNAINIFFNGMVLLILFISTSVASLQKYQQETKTRHALEQQKITSELSFLKAQINPHFFFNTLNNIYALTMFDVESSRQALLTLSRMMRYVLYDTQTEEAQLSKEIAFIQDYINLMQLRLTDKVKVTFEKPETLKDVPIAPMLLLPFVENAFKHGINATQPSHIFIGIRQADSALEIEVRNSIFDEKVKSLEVSNGIGLVNTRRRLDLLYPNRYEIAVTERTPANEFRVYLKLKLT